MIKQRPIDEIIEFIISSPNPEKVLAYRPSQALQERIEDLIYKKKTSFLSNEENIELERYLLIEHIMIMAKKRARKELSQ
ncbi:hypothetical protein [Runella slithyformis]|uniref:Uncharacterized protein n=1 Tax=Runella slithyformis (strain ATCC 29530 / DSM 19594 / LMG 11500 / NCIMB 11436 / LSU 4) TaxID=761193 RepID=A0A7U4E413_RUNSL|nr:hypothetical protein [Runella slithyformis]AEI46968.1 hypothetical protein Runsl_0524 [Runella slithyformis DSM 19594]